MDIMTIVFHTRDGNTYEADTDPANINLNKTFTVVKNRNKPDQQTWRLGVEYLRPSNILEIPEATERGLNS